jgi:hypothetical protein
MTVREERARFLAETDAGEKVLDQLSLLEYI